MWHCSIFRDIKFLAVKQMSSKSVQVRVRPQMSLGQVSFCHQINQGEKLVWDFFAFRIAGLGDEYLPDSFSLALSYSPTSPCYPPTPIPSPLPSIPPLRNHLGKWTPVNPKKSSVSQRGKYSPAQMSRWQCVTQLEEGGFFTPTKLRKDSRDLTRLCYY